MITVSRKVVEHYNLGSYEWAEAGTTVTAEFDLEDDVALDYDAVAAQFQNAIDRLLQPERERYLLLTTEDNSMLHDHPALSRRNHGDNPPSPSPDQRGRGNRSRR
jgi:hypothetical protein